MKKISLVVLTMTVFVIAILFMACDVRTSPTPVVPDEHPVVLIANPKLDMPTFSPSIATSFVDTFTVVITPGANAPPEAKIHYTLNGNEPSETVGGTTVLYVSDGITFAETTPVIKAIAIASGMTTSNVAISPVFTKTTKLDAPTFSHSEATGFEDNLVVSIHPGAGAPAGSKIHYTLNGDDPNEDATGSSSLYDAVNKITLTETTPAIKAIVISDGLHTSDIATSPIFTKMDRLDIPTFTPSVATGFETSQLVTITVGANAPAGAKIHYTVNGDEPSETASGTTMLYVSSGITLTETTTAIKAIVIADGMFSSNVATSATFTNIKLDTPTFTPSVATDFETSQLVTITAGASAPTGATIHYTLNGDIPSETIGGSTMLYVSGGITLTETTSGIKAIVIASGMITSDVATSSTFTNLVWNGTDVSEPLETSNVYEVYHPSELAWIAAQTSNDFSGKTVKLMENLNMGNHLFAGIVEFSGIFDGNNKEITNININEPTEPFVGLIRILNGGTIQNLTIGSGSIQGGSTSTANSVYVGAFAGKVAGTTEFNGLINGATVTAETNSSNLSFAGGIIGGIDTSATGSIDTTIQDTKNIADVSGKTLAGGIIGFTGLATNTNITTNITNTENTGSVTSDILAGGMSGYCANTITMTSVKNSGVIDAVYSGGMIGYGTASIETAENSGNVLGSSYAGGIIGFAYGSVPISNSGNSGNITANGSGATYAGGISGLTSNATTIDYAYNYGEIIGSIKGGMTGRSNSTTITESYYLDTATHSVGAGPTTDSSVPLSAAEFVVQSSFSGWNFSTIWQMGSLHPILQ